jgi:FAD/FMN-containing dehydrogenase
MTWVEAFRRAMLPYVCGAYVNYIDSNIEDWPSAYYGTNFEKLMRVKAKYDPQNVFRFPQSIPPAQKEGCAETRMGERRLERI